MPTTGPRCWSLEEVPPHVCERYRRFALVSVPRHLELLGRDDAETLVVSSSWLLWQKAVADGRHCIHYESRFRGEDPLRLGTDVYLRCCDWTYVDGRDATMFGGVSLGRKLANDVWPVVLEWDRLNQALRGLMQRYRPREIVFFDLSTELGFLDVPARLALVAAIAAEFGATVVDRRDPAGEAAPEMPVRKPYYDAQGAGAPKKGAREFLLDVFDVVADAASRLRRRIGRRRPVLLMLTTQLTGIPLLDQFDGRGLFTAYLARRFPGKSNIRFLLGNWLKGVLLVSAPKPPLGDEDRCAVDTIERTLLTAWSADGRIDGDSSDIQAEVRRYVATHILGGGRLHKLAAEVRQAEAVLDRYRPDVVFTDGLMNRTTTIYLELAKRRGIRTVSTFHSPYIQDTKLAVFGSDPRVPSLSDCCLTWGRAHEDWLASTGATCPAVRTGNAVARRLRSATPQPTRRRIGRGRALLLQYAVPMEDGLWPHTGQFEFFVAAVRMLRELGFAEIRVKLHPGPQSVDYHMRIADFFGLDCEIYREGSFMDFVEWSDVVIGPIHSGAILETISAGKPCYPVLLAPHMVNMRYLDGCQVFDGVASLRRALQDDAVPDHRTTLSHFISFDEIADPVARVWTALRDGMAAAVAAAAASPVGNRGSEPAPRPSDAVRSR